MKPNRQSLLLMVLAGWVAVAGSSGEPFERVAPLLDANGGDSMMPYIGVPFGAVLHVLMTCIPEMGIARFDAKYAKLIGHAGSTLVEAAEIRLGSHYGNAVLRIRTVNQAKKNTHVASVEVKGVELKKQQIRHADLVRGGELVFTMTKGEPCCSWATDPKEGIRLPVGDRQDEVCRIL